MPLKLKPPALPNQPPPDTPTTESSAKRKLTLKFAGASQTSSPTTNAPTSALAAAKPKPARKTKADKPTRIAKPTPKKRDLDAALADDDEAPKENGLANVKRLKLSISGISKPRPPSPPKDADWKAVKRVRTIFKGKIPERPIGVGYDSGSSDVEVDPALEEEFILRMQPGEDCEYIRQAVAERKWGSIAEGGANVRLQFLRRDGRRAIVYVQKRLYAACLVDLPCVVEGMKSWDKKAWFKTADVCQMLMVLGRIEKEEAALEYPLPKDVDPKTWQYAHGLTPPMRYARKRRFRKRISKNAIEAVEEEVERLLALDAEYEAKKGDSKYEVIDPDRLTQEQQENKEVDEFDDEEDAEGDEEDEDAEGDDDIENNYEAIEEDEEGDDAAMEAALAAAMEDDEAATETTATLVTDTQPTTQLPEPTTATPASPATADTPSQPRFISDSEPPSVAATPAAQTTTSADDEDNSSDESDEDAPSELDDAEVEEKRERERQWAEVNDIKNMIKLQEEKAAGQPNAILKGKILANMRALRKDLGVRLAALGVDEEAEEEG